MLKSEQLYDRCCGSGVRIRKALNPQPLDESQSNGLRHVRPVRKEDKTIFICSQFGSYNCAIYTLIQIGKGDGCFPL